MKWLLWVVVMALWSASAWGGPLETSFHPGLPADLEFGDSPEALLKKMGRPPDGRTGSSAFRLYTYTLPGTEHFPPSRLDCLFEGDRLKSLTLALPPIAITHHDLEESTRPVFAVYEYLDGLYGRRHWCAREVSCPYLSVAAWPQENNVLFLVPDSGFWFGDQDKIVKLSLWLAPPTSAGENLPSHLSEWKGWSGCIKGDADGE